MINTITFPGLGLNFHVSQIAFNLFGIDIYAYAICIVIGILTALIFCKLSDENYYIKFDCVLETLLFSIIFGIIGARIYYVMFNLEYYAADFSRIINLRDGGLALYGGFITGGFVAVKLCRKYKVSPIEFFDYIVPFVALAQSIGRWGNLFNIEAYGYSTSSLFRMGITTLEGYMEVHPIFLYESIATFCIFLILKSLQGRRKFPGQIFYSYLVLYCGVRAVLEGMRVDSLMFFGFRISQVLSIIVFIYATIIVLKKTVNYYLKKYRQRMRKKMTKNIEFCQSKKHSNTAILLTLL